MDHSSSVCEKILGSVFLNIQLNSHLVLPESKYKKYYRNSTTQSRLLTTLRKKLFEKIVGKGANAAQCCTLPKTHLSFSATFIRSSANAFNLYQS